MDSPRGTGVRPAAGAPLLRRDLAIAAAISIAAFCLYLTTVCRTIFWGDSVEFAVLLPLLDIAHPTGYPLFSLLGKAFSLLPLGSVAFRLNLFGCVLTAPAVGLLYLIARRLGLRTGAALAGAGLLAVSREVWAQSSAIEVYSLQASLTALALLLALGFRQEPTERRFIGLAAVLGLSFANHMTTMWTLPCVAWLMFIGLREAGGGSASSTRTLAIPSRRALAWAGLVFAAGISLYLYLPLRSLQGPLFNYGEPSTLRALFDHVSGQQFRYRMFEESDGALERFAGLLCDQLTPWLLPVAAVGFALIARRDWQTALGLGLLCVVHLFFAVNYRIPDKGGYFLPIYLVVAVSCAAAADALPGLLGRARPAQARVASGVLALALVIPPAWTNLPLVDKSGDRSLEDYTRETLKRLPPDSLLLVHDFNIAWAASYQQLFEGADPDRMVVSEYLLCLPWYIHHLRRHFPALALPPSVDELVARRAREVEDAEGPDVGALSKRFAAEVARTLVEANRPKRRVFWSAGLLEDESAWQSMPLLARGLFREFVDKEDAGKAEPWSIDFPDPSHYRKEELRAVQWKRVAAAFASACNRAGLMLAGAGRYPEAEAAFLRAIEYDSEYAMPHLNLGLIYGDFFHDSARRIVHWRRFLELAPGDPQAEVVRKKLQPLDTVDRVKAVKGAT